MKKSIIFVSLVLAFSAASATNKPPTPQYPVINEYTYNNPQAHSSAAALSAAAAISGANSNATGGAGGNSSAVGTGGAGGVGGNSSAIGGMGGTVASDAIKNNVNVEGTTYERNTPPAIAPNIPSVVRSCRLYISLAGSVASGAGAGGIPIGNDATCLALTKIEVMGIIGGFPRSEKVRVACTIEGMNELDSCKNVKQ